jgi:hypothetical protein
MECESIEVREDIVAASELEPVALSSQRLVLPVNAVNEVGHSEPAVTCEVTAVHSEPNVELDLSCNNLELKNDARKIVGEIDLEPKRLRAEVVAKVEKIITQRFTRVVTDFAENDFETSCRHQRVLIDPRTNRPQQYLDAANKVHMLSPNKTSFCALIPRWRDGTFCSSQLSGWTKVHTFGKGEKLYESGSDGNVKVLRGMRWPIEVWYLPAEVSKSPLLPQCTELNALGHPTFLCHGVSSSAPVRVGIKTHTSALSQEVLIDTGATESFINPAWLIKAGYNLDHCLKPCARTVKLADKSLRQVTGYLDLHLKIGQYRGKVRLLVMNIGDYDVILGDDWLTKNKAFLDFATKQCIVRQGKRRWVINPISSKEKRTVGNSTPSEDTDEVPSAIISALQVKRAIRKAEQVYWVLVNAVDEGEVTCASVSDGSKDHEEQIEQITDPNLREVLRRRRQVFGPIPPGLPKDRNAGHTIRLMDNALPPWRAVYKMSTTEKDELATQIKEMLAKGWIQPSTSPFGAPVLFVKKKDGTLRMCIDYRALNKLTVRNRYPLPRIDDLLDAVGKAKFFTSLDLASGYHQIRITEEDREKTAFRTPFGHYEWRVLSMGLTNAPSTFQAVMNEVFAGQIGKHVVVYMDDILIFSKTREEHLRHLDEVLATLEKEALYCKLPKCTFLAKEINYLGHIIDEHGLRPDPNKVQVVKDWPCPQNQKDVRSFLGLCNYFRKFIKSYSHKVYPLTQLLRKEVVKSKRDAVPWGPDEQSSFELIKRALTEAPTLAHYDPNKRLEMICDASKVALGGVLVQDGKPLAYESRKLNPAETRYATGDRELLAVIHCLKVWRCYLHGAEFTLVTDHKPNTYLKSIENWNDRQARWSEKLEAFSYTWEYRRGADNIADPLSRLSASDLNDTRASRNAQVKIQREQMASQCAVAMLASAHETKAFRDKAGHVLSDFKFNWRRKNTKNELEDAASTLCSLHAAITRRMATDIGLREQPAPIQSGEGPNCPNLPQVTESESEKPIRKYQKLDLKVLKEAYQLESFKTELSAPFAKETFKQKANGFWYNDDKLVIPSGILAEEFRRTIFKEHHATPFSGHQGADRTLSSLRQRFWWKGMASEVRKWVKQCDCQRNKASTKKPYGQPQMLEVPHTPWHTITMDFITGLPQTENGFDSIAVFVDKLTKMVHLAPFTNKGLNADGVANLFMEQVFKLHGVPARIVSDRDSKLTAQFWKEVTARLGSKCNFSTAYHPQTDGQTERYNRVLEEVLRNFVSPTMTNWAELLPACEFALNSHVHKGTHYSPFFLNYGRNPTRPIDLALKDAFQEDTLQGQLYGSDDLTPNQSGAAQRIHKLHMALQRAHTYLVDAKDRMAKREAAKYHSRDEDKFKEGKMVWLSSRNFVWKSGSRKLCPKWIGPFTIVKRYGPVTFKLDLPDDWRMHPVFHISLLKPFEKGPDYHAPKPVKVIDGEPEWEISAIVKHRYTTHGATEFLVHWKGFGPEWQTWIPEHNLEHAKRQRDRYMRSVQANPEFGQVDDEK